MLTMERMTRQRGWCILVILLEVVMCSVAEGMVLCTVTGESEHSELPGSKQR